MWAVKPRWMPDTRALVHKCFVLRGAYARFLSHWLAIARKLGLV